MRNLIHGILDFRRRLLPGLVDTFKKLDEGQHPDCLFIACSDSRVVPNLFASTNPGEMFVVRNVGNLIPPCIKTTTDKSTYENVSMDKSTQFLDSSGAALEFSTMALKINNIVVCGHSKCGAMNKVHECNGDTKSFYETTPYISNWLNNALTSLERLKKYRETREPMVFKGLSEEGDVLAHIDLENLSQQDQLSQVNVLQQLEHVASYGVVSDRVNKKELILHAWWFNLGKAEVWAFSVRKQRFLLLDDEKAQVLLDRIDEVEKGAFKNSNPDSTPPWIAGVKTKKNKSKL